MSNEPKPGQFKTWAELLLAALTQKREIQILVNGEWVRSSLNDILHEGCSRPVYWETSNAVLASLRLKPKLQKVYFGYSPTQNATPYQGSIVNWTTDFYADEASARKAAPDHWRIGTTEIEVDE